MRAKHTPGPWEAKGKSVRSKSHTAIGSAPNGHQGGICNCLGKRMGSRSRIDEAAEANARLIAAAPDLLAALEKAVEHYGKPGGPWNVPSEPGTWISDARAAIAKAKGEAP